MSATVPAVPEGETWVMRLLRAEALVELALLVGGYAWLGGSWWLFGALFLLPDLGMLGYFAGPRLGAACYNATHVLLAPALLGAAAVSAGWELGGMLALIWAAHIAFDRALGYGLKYPTAFGDTHLGRRGR